MAMCSGTFAVMAKNEVFVAVVIAVAWFKVAKKASIGWLFFDEWLLLVRADVVLD